jgi:hypothetical protein
VFSATNNQNALSVSDVPNKLIYHESFSLKIPACSLFFCVTRKGIAIVNGNLSFFAYRQWHINHVPVPNYKARAGSNSLIELFSNKGNGPISYNFANPSGEIALLLTRNCVNIFSDRFIQLTPIGPSSA